MKEVQLDLVEFGDCEEQFRKTRLGDRFKLHDSFICAIGQQDTCKGKNWRPSLFDVLAITLCSFARHNIKKTLLVRKNSYFLMNAISIYFGIHNLSET
jgi:hypothetical protein